MAVASTSFKLRQILRFPAHNITGRGIDIRLGGLNVAFRSGGLATGLDTNTIIQQLVAIEKQPIHKLNVKRTGYSTKISKLGKIKSSVLGLRSQARALDTTKEFLVAKATPSDTDFFNATATGDAALASYDITVSQLATGEKTRSASYAAATSEVKAGGLTFSVNGGDDQLVTIDAGMTLEQAAARINEQVSGISAAVIVGKTESRLVISANETGFKVGGNASDAIVVSEAYTGGTGTELGLTEFATAKNAVMTIDGVAVESSKNEVTSALSGVTFNLKKITTQTETLSVAKDTDKVVENVKSFVTSYNKVIELLNLETKVTAKTNRLLSLGGDSAIRSLGHSLKKAVTQKITSLSANKYNSLASIGIKNLNGKMTLDESKLKTAMDDNVQQVAALFTAADGVTKTVIPLTEAYGLSGGVLSGRVEGMTKSMRNIDNRILGLENRVAKVEQQLIKQFSALEQAVAGINKQSSFLAGSLG